MERRKSPRCFSDAINGEHFTPLEWRSVCIFVSSNQGNSYAYEHLDAEMKVHNVMCFLLLYAVILLATFCFIQGGNLVERRLHQRKWKWVVHGSPRGEHLTSISQVLQDEFNDKFYSLFVTSSSGSVFEYRISKKSGQYSRSNNKKKRTRQNKKSSRNLLFDLLLFISIEFNLISIL